MIEFTSKELSAIKNAIVANLDNIDNYYELKDLLNTYLPIVTKIDSDNTDEDKREKAKSIEVSKDIYDKLQSFKETKSITIAVDIANTLCDLINE